MHTRRGENRPPKTFFSSKFSRTLTTSYPIPSRRIPSHHKIFLQRQEASCARVRQSLGPQPYHYYYYYYFDDDGARSKQYTLDYRVILGRYRRRRRKALANRNNAVANKSRRHTHLLRSVRLTSRRRRKRSRDHKNPSDEGPKLVRSTTNNARCF